MHNVYDGKVFCFDCNNDVSSGSTSAMHVGNCVIGDNITVTGNISHRIDINKFLNPLNIGVDNGNAYIYVRVCIL